MYMIMRNGATQWQKSGSGLVMDTPNINSACGRDVLYIQQLSNMSRLLEAHLPQTVLDNPRLFRWASSWSCRPRLCLSHQEMGGWRRV